MPILFTKLSNILAHASLRLRINFCASYDIYLTIKAYRYYWLTSNPLIWLRGRELKPHCQRESEKAHDYSGASFSLCSEHVLMADRSVASTMQQPLLVEQSSRRESSGLRNQVWIYYDSLRLPRLPLWMASQDCYWAPHVSVPSAAGTAPTAHLVCYYPAVTRRHLTVPPRGLAVPVIFWPMICRSTSFTAGTKKEPILSQTDS